MNAAIDYTILAMVHAEPGELTAPLLAEQLRVPVKKIRKRLYALRRRGCFADRAVRAPLHRQLVPKEATAMLGPSLWTPYRVRLVRSVVEKGPLPMADLAREMEEETPS